jgi:hypothetical protein
MGTVSRISHNQNILQNQAKKIAGDFEQGLNPQANKPETSSLWSVIKNKFPTSSTVGRFLGTNAVLAYGAGWSNDIIGNAIDALVKYFVPESVQPQEPSYWERMKSFVTGTTRMTVQQTIAQGLKLSLTPFLVPYVATFAGTSGAIALPLAIAVVSSIYHRAIGHGGSNKLKKLNEGLIKIDPNTGQVRDNFGNLLSKDETKAIFTVIAKYNLVFQLLDICQKVDQKMIEEKKTGNAEFAQRETQELIQQLIGTYFIKREDGQVMFQDGTLVTPEMNQKILNGIETLSRSNRFEVDKAQQSIQSFVELIAEHSFIPLEKISTEDHKCLQAIIDGEKELETLLTPKELEAFKQVLQLRKRQELERFLKSLPSDKRSKVISAQKHVNLLKKALRDKAPKSVIADFPEGSRFKNTVVVQASDGQYVIVQSQNPTQENGSIVNAETMNEMLNELEKVREEKKAAQMKELKALLLQPAQRQAFIEQLSQLDREDMLKFVKSCFVTSRTTGQTFYLDGQPLPRDPARLLRTLELNANDAVERKVKIDEAIEELSAEVGQEKASQMRQEIDKLIYGSLEDEEKSSKPTEDLLINIQSAIAELPGQEQFAQRQKALETLMKPIFDHLPKKRGHAERELLKLETGRFLNYQGEVLNQGQAEIELEKYYQTAEMMQDFETVDNYQVSRESSHFLIKKVNNL